MSSILAARLKKCFYGARNTEQLLIFIKKNFKKLSLMYFLDDNKSIGLTEVFLSYPYEVVSYSEPFGIGITTTLGVWVYFHHTDLSYLANDYAIIAINEYDAYYIMLKPYSHFTPQEKNIMQEQAYKLLQRLGRVIENQDIPF